MRLKYILTTYLKRSLTTTQISLQREICGNKQVPINLVLDIDKQPKHSATSDADFIYLICFDIIKKLLPRYNYGTFIITLNGRRIVNLPQHFTGGQQNELLLSFFYILESQFPVIRYTNKSCFHFASVHILNKALKLQYNNNL